MADSRTSAGLLLFPKVIRRDADEIPNWWGFD
jgi:hypothetical protein